MKREEPSFLLVGSIFYIVIAGVLARRLKIRYIFLANIITGVISLLLAMYFIPSEDGWFKPFGRDFAIVFTLIIFFVGQLLVRLFLKISLEKVSN